MNDMLKEQLEVFQRLTGQIIELIKNEDYDRVNELFDERQRCIEVLDGMEYSQEEFTKLVNELDLITLDHQLNQDLAKAKEAVAQNLDKLKNHWNAKNEYTKRYSVDSMFYNKKI